MQLVVGGVDVQLSIMTEHLRGIPLGSHARHAREAGIVGASVIDIIPSRSAVPLAEGSQIHFEPARGIAEIVDDLRRQAIPALHEVKQAMGQVGRTGEDITQILAGLRREVDQLPATHRAVRKLVEEATFATSELSIQAGATLQSVERVAENMDRTVPVLSEKLAASIDTINSAAAQMRTSASASRPRRDRGARRERRARRREAHLAARRQLQGHDRRHAADRQLRGRRQGALQVDAPRASARARARGMRSAEAAG
jgi:primosomal protein N''